MPIVNLTIDGKQVAVEAGTSILKAAQQNGIDIPYYCYHSGLSIAGNCRICLVEVEKMPKLTTACSTPVGEGMVVKVASEKASTARRGVLELMLANHPVDCPVCDQAGECKLQEYYMTVGQHKSRLAYHKVHKPKVKSFPPHISFDAERCIMCSRCVRFCKEITKTNELSFIHRGAHVEIHNAAKDERIENGYVGNLHEICPVGALTSTDFRFQQRVWWLKSAKSICPGCSAGCNVTVQHNRGKVYRLLARENQAVNKWWLCDEGRYGFHSVNAESRLTSPRMTGGQASVSLSNAIETALRRLLDAEGRIAGLASAQLTNEELYVFKKLIVETLGGMVEFRTGDDYLKVDQASDKLLQKADKALNTRGAIALGYLGPDDTLTLLAKAAKGEFKALYLLDACRFEREPYLSALSAARKKVDTIIMHSAHASPVLEFADIVLPSASWVEKDGTATNFEGRVQRMERAFAPKGEVRSDLAIILEMLPDAQAKGIVDAATVFDAMAAEIKPFNGLTYASLPDEGALIPVFT